MHTPILATKLHISAPRSQVVPRTHLIERLNEGLAAGRKLTLISAPAGFGKTTLVSKWVAGCKHPVAWLSLEEADNDSTRFLTYLVAALQTIAANTGEGALRALESPQPPPVELVLTTLLNEIAILPDQFVLVLDDYHVIDAKPVDNALTFLLEHLPPPMHLIIATREDPQLPLARLRVQGQLTELRAKDLRFTLPEAAGFLNQVMGLNLSEQDVAALENRTEGWIAGLQLAAISLQGRQDAAEFIKSFTGSHHFVMDYLVEQVLQRQSESVQTFLLRTSILDRLSGPLCDAVLLDASASGQETLEYLERANLFVVPLDDERQWYRYHHLFAHTLQTRLAKEHPDHVPDLHRRACAWYAQNDLRAEAIHHALAAREFERAADLIELERSANLGTYFRNTTWFNWVKALPDALIRTRPRLSVGFAWELLFSGELEAAEGRMTDAERSLQYVADEAEAQSVRASLAITRAFHAQALGDVEKTTANAYQALGLIAPSDYYARALANSLLGLAYLTNGDLENAYCHISDAMLSLRMGGYLLFSTSSTYVLADLRITQGRLLDAARIYQDALQYVTAPGRPLIPGTANLYLGLSELSHEWGNVDKAQAYALKSEELGERGALPDWPYRQFLVQARMKQANGDLDGALELLNQAEGLYHRSPVPDLRPVAALKARVWTAQGKLTEAFSWVQTRKLSVDDRLSYTREFEHITLARVLIGSYKRDRTEHTIQDAIRLLARLRDEAENGGRTGSLIEIFVVHALAHQAQGNVPLALSSLERALTLAQPEGYVRVFVDEGKPMAELLAGVYRRLANPAIPIDSHAGTTRMKEYVSQLLGAFAPRPDVPPLSSAPQENSGVLQPMPSSAIPQSLVEPLSPRELEILQLIAQGLSNQEIGERLFLALPTVKGHNRHIFDKLQVKNRTEAVVRARQLRIL